MKTAQEWQDNGLGWITADLIQSIQTDAREPLLAALKEVECCCEQALHHLDEGGNASKHDPSWIRPIAMTKPEMVNACQQAYHQIHHAIARIKEVVQ